MEYPRRKLTNGKQSQSDEPVDTIFHLRRMSVKTVHAKATSSCLSLAATDS
jgi:hypothetical protein